MPDVAISRIFHGGVTNPPVSFADSPLQDGDSHGCCRALGMTAKWVVFLFLGYIEKSSCKNNNGVL